MHNREITHIVKTESSSKTQLKEQILVLQSDERNLCQEQKNTKLYLKKKHDAKAIFKTLNIQTVKLPPFVLNIWGDL